MELKWRIPIDAILRLRARSAAGGKPQLTDPANSVTSQLITLNGIPLFIRLTRILRDDVPPVEQQQPDEAVASPTKRFEHHVVACHLISAVPAGGTPLTPALLSRSGSAFAQRRDHPAGSDTHDNDNNNTDEDADDTHDQVQQMERQMWERKVAFLTEVGAVPRQYRAIHPAVGASSTSTNFAASSSAHDAPPSRVRRVVEGILSSHNRSVGFSSLIPLRELLMYYVASAPTSATTGNPPNGGARTGESDDTALCYTEFTFKIFLSHAWQDCIALHNKAAAASRHMYNLVGLKNHGSTCYINVLIQSLYHISFFRREVMALTDAGRRKSEAALQIQRIFYELEHSKVPVDTMGLLRAVRVNPSLQNDSHEFLSEFFLHRVFKNITDMFSFKVKYLTTCQDVDFTSTSEETLFELSLCVGPKYPTLESAVQKEFAKEPISDLYDTGVHEFGKQKASRQMCMVTFPPILFMHSKRFDHFAKKVHTSQTFPLSFEVAAGHEYHLHSVIVHHGTGVNSGHFTAFVRVADAARGQSPPSGVDGATAENHSNVAEAHPSIPTTFFHFDDEAVYSVPTPQVLEEAVGVHWTSPSSSAYILIYVEADAFVDATVTPVATPPDVRATVEKMIAAAAAQSAANSPLTRSINRSPPPALASAASSTTSPRPAAPLVIPMSSSPTPQNQLPRRSSNSPPAVREDMQLPRSLAAPATGSPHSTNSSATNRRRSAGQLDASDMPRLLTACRELRECETAPMPQLAREDYRKIRVTVWTIAGLREVMSILGTAHDLVDMRYVPKYLRQEAQLHKTADGDHALWGTASAACSLLLPYDTTIAELRTLVDTAMGVFPVRQHFSNTGDIIGGFGQNSSTSSDPAPASSAKVAELFAFHQRRNGTWRPSYPLFDTFIEEEVQEGPAADDGAFETPRRENKNDSVFSSTNHTNISGSFTVRRRANIQHHHQEQLGKPRRCPPPSVAPYPSASIKPVTLAHVSEEVLRLHALNADIGAVSELHLLACSTFPIQSIVSGDGVMSPLTVSQASATPLYHGSQLRGSRRGSPLTRGPLGSGGTVLGAMSSNASGVVERVIASEVEDDDQVVNESISSFIHSSALEPTDHQQHTVVAEGSGLLLVSNPMPPLQGDAAPNTQQGEALTLLPTAAADSPLVIMQPQTSVFMHSLHGTTDSGNSAMLIMKSSVGSRTASLRLMGAFYVPLEWNILRLVVTLLQCGYLNWAPLSAAGIASFRVQHLQSIAQRSSSWMREDNELLAALQEHIQVFEEVRPERLDEVSDWVSTTVEALLLDHGDILVFHQKDVESRKAATQRRRGTIDEDLFSDEEGTDDDRVSQSQSLITTSALLVAQALVDSCRRQVLGCTILSPLWGALRAGSTVFCLVDLQYMDQAALEALFLAKLRQVALFMGADEGDMAALQQQPSTPQGSAQLGPIGTPPSSSQSSRLPNMPSPQHTSQSARHGSKGPQYCWSWWCVDASHPPKVQAASEQTTESRASLSHRTRMLKQASSSQVAEVNVSLHQTAAAAALQVGSSGAPISLLATLFPTACTTLLQWGEWILPGSTATASAAPLQITNGANSDVSKSPTSATVDAPLSCNDFATPAKRPTLRTSPLLDDGAFATPAPLFDVSASVASRNYRLPWNSQHPALNDQVPKLQPQPLDPPRDAHPGTHLAALHPATGLLLSTTLRLFVDLRLVHQAAPPTITTTILPPNTNTPHPLVVKDKKSLPSSVASRSADIVILWFGWCKAIPTHRFRLRSVDLSSNALSLFSLAAQFLGFLDGVVGSCAAEGDHALPSTPQCLHEYPLVHQLAIAIIGPNQSGASVGSPVTATSSPVTPRNGSAQPQVGVYRKIIPIISLLALHDAHGCTAPPLRSDVLVADLLRMLGVHTVPRHAAGPGASLPQPVVELALMLLPNAPMDMEEAFRHVPSNATTSIGAGTMEHLQKGSTGGSKVQPHIDATTTRQSLLRWIDIRRSACMLTVCVLRRSNMQAITFPGLIPASDTIDELRLWLDQLYPLRDAELLLEVHVPSQMQGLHPSIQDLHDAAQCDFWLPRDINEYCQRLSGAASKRASSGATASPSQQASSLASSAVEAGANAAAAVPSIVNHRKYSVSFLNLQGEDPAEYRALVQRSVTFHHYLMRKSSNGLKPMEHFEVKKILLLFPARLLVFVP